MKAIRHSTLEKTVKFQKCGGRVIIIGELPTLTERQGKNDEAVLALTEELSSAVCKNVRELITMYDKDFTRDFYSQNVEKTPIYIHRNINGNQIYVVYGAAKCDICFFRAKGNVILLDPFTGSGSSIQDEF